MSVLRHRRRITTVILLTGFGAVLATTGPIHAPSTSLARPSSPPAVAVSAAPASTVYTVSMTAPQAGASLSAGTPVTLTAQLSPDLVTDLSSGKAGCWFMVGDDANANDPSSLNLAAGTCTGTWTYSYAGTFTITAQVMDASANNYSSPAISVNVSGASDPRCTGANGAPPSCVYRWAEAYYTSASSRFLRVCSIDGSCQWATAHTSWTQVSGKDYWTHSNANGSALPDGNIDEAYLCTGSAPSDWNSYAATHSLATLLSQPETSVTPVPAGTCSS